MGAPRGAKPSALADRDVAPAGQVIDLRAPAGLGKAARAVWDVVVPFLRDRGALEHVDVVLLVELAELLALARRYREAIGVLVGNPSALCEDEDDVGLAGPAEVVEALALASPAVKRLRSGYVECMSRATSLASCFGLTPTDRVRLGLTAGGEGGASLGEVVAAAMKSALVDGAVPV
jgi:P27 family predicted phage terminase small subunit